MGGLSLVTWRRRRGVEYSNTRVRVVTYSNCTTRMYEYTRMCELHSHTTLNKLTSTVKESENVLLNMLSYMYSYILF